MKKTSIKKALSLLVCIVLIAAMALVSSGCKDKNTNLISSEPTAQSQTVVKELGEGKTKFDFEVTDKDGNEICRQNSFASYTNQMTLNVSDWMEVDAEELAKFAGEHITVTCRISTGETLVLFDGTIG